MVVVVLGATVPVWAQPRPAAGGRTRKDPRRPRVTRPNVPNRPTTRGARPKLERQQWMQDARELTAKVQRSGPWSNHSRVMAQAVESMWQRANWNTDADLFIKRLMIDVGKRPP